MGELQAVCRHTYASYWLVKNESMYKIFMNMGHTKPTRSH